MRGQGITGWGRGPSELSQPASEIEGSPNDRRPSKPKRERSSVAGAWRCCSSRRVSRLQVALSTSTVRKAYDHVLQNKRPPLKPMAGLQELRGFLARTHPFFHLFPGVAHPALTPGCWLRAGCSYNNKMGVGFRSCPAPYAHLRFTVPHLRCSLIRPTLSRPDDRAYSLPALRALSEIESGGLSPCRLLGAQAEPNFSRHTLMATNPGAKRRQ